MQLLWIIVQGSAHVEWVQEEELTLTRVWIWKESHNRFELNKCVKGDTVFERTFVLKTKGVVFLINFNWAYLVKYRKPRLYTLHN